MSGLSQSESSAVIARLRTLLGEGDARPPLNRIATEAVLGRKQRRGERFRTDQLRDRQRLQRCLCRCLGKSPPLTIRERSFETLAAGLEAYRAGWGEELRVARAEAAGREEWKAFEDVKSWFQTATDVELAAFQVFVPGETERSAFTLPDWVLLPLLGKKKDGPSRRCLLLDALRAGIPSTIAMEAILRVLSPFCGHARSGGRLLAWNELTVPALRRALHASIEAERIWLGLTVPRLKGNSTTARGVAPLKDRLPNPLRGSPGLLATFSP